MATASNLSSPVLGPTSKLQPNGQLGETGLDKGLREEELQRHFSVWSVSTRSTGSSSDDLNKIESDDEKRHSSTEDGLGLTGDVVPNCQLSSSAAKRQAVLGNGSEWKILVPWLRAGAFDSDDFYEAGC
ncbi:unnamed protein product [Symbiodinium sp. CCMP2592]|nr:unnamed protein product [Symbiodinium sp. CCMP2592]